MRFVNAILSPLILFLIAIVSCEDLGYSSFKIHIDSLAHPATVMVSQEVDIEYYGFVGPDGCHDFKTIQMEPLSDSLIQFTVWGERSDYETICPAVEVYLEGETYTMTLDAPGWHHIRV
ncbi:MAG: hypothetical protein K9N34_01875, partial [Candidatus Marinimicrobia bacterium]|nr:hypothetical protein [Candidatus Neomarinimicrobiota bacterium]